MCVISSGHLDDLLQYLIGIFCIRCLKIIAIAPEAPWSTKSQRTMDCPDAIPRLIHRAAATGLRAVGATTADCC